MTRTAPQPRDEGLARSGSPTRGAAPLPRHAPSVRPQVVPPPRFERTSPARPPTAPLPPVIDPGTGHDDRWTALLPAPRHRAAGPCDAQTDELPVVRGARGSGSRVRGIDA